MQTLANFFTGMIVAVFVFLFRLPSLIWSYSPTLVRGLATAACWAVLHCSLPDAVHQSHLQLHGSSPTLLRHWVARPSSLCPLPPLPLQWSGLAFFSLAAVAGVSVVASYLVRLQLGYSMHTVASC